MKKITLLLLYYLCQSCADKNNSFDEFDITYSNFFQVYNSIKLTNSDTVFIRKYYEDFELKNPYYHKDYYAILNKTDRDNINKAIANINLYNYDSVYQNKIIVDGFIYRIYLKKDDTEKSIFVSNKMPPEELNQLKQLILKSVDNLKLLKTDKNFSIKSQDIFPEPEKITY
ncbi:hypothetical protein HXZ62_08100 [Empedobacter falsenii]|uniref:hypothetical protein n=1 Tax=Empedobacter falsenii TaxID=343874 RepID=UPI002577A8CE|nr:hypothetical protein [Empedobacter falsenii]MDM1062523.1 hypothetical protein [Empedobacter falsenii]